MSGETLDKSTSSLGRNIIIIIGIINVRDAYVIRWTTDKYGSESTLGFYVTQLGAGE